MKSTNVKLVKINLESEFENRWFFDRFGNHFKRNELKYHIINIEEIKDNVFLQTKINSQFGLISTEWDFIEIYPFVN